MADDNAPDTKEEPAAGGSEWKDPAQAVAYATLILIAAEKSITEENIQKLLSAAKCEVDSRLPQTFQRAVDKGMDLKDLIDNFGKGAPAAAAPTAATGGAGATEAKKEEPEEESEKSSSKAGPGLFGDDGSSSDESSSG
eukprot:134179_1